MKMECKILNYIDPSWYDAGKVHDWRNYIGPDLQRIWGSFTDDQRRIIAYNADDIASNEEWD
jgi:hypothetical protein